MDRNRVFELAREAELARQLPLEVPFVVDRLERFAALIERELVLDMLQRLPETNCHGESNVYRGVRCKDSSKPTYVWPFIETVKGVKDGQG